MYFFLKTKSKSGKKMHTFPKWMEKLKTEKIVKYAKKERRYQN